MWEHPKFEALRQQNCFEALALWSLCHSYTNAKGNPRVTLAEAAMLLSVDQDRARLACEALVSVGLFDEADEVLLRSKGEADPFSASKQTASWLLHDWKQYRSKSQAKVEAGRKGGKKSAASRRSKVEAKPKQTSSKAQADVKQGSSPDPDPESRSRSHPDPSIPLEASASRDESDGLKLHEIEQLGFAKCNALTGVAAVEIKRLMPVFREELLDALAEPRVKNWKYLARVLEGVREVRARGAPPQGKRGSKNPLDNPLSGAYAGGTPSAWIPLPTADEIEERRLAEDQET